MITQNIALFKYQGVHRAGKDNTPRVTTEVFSPIQHGQQIKITQTHNAPFAHIISCTLAKPWLINAPRVEKT